MPDAVETEAVNSVLRGERTRNRIGARDGRQRAMKRGIGDNDRRNLRELFAHLAQCRDRGRVVQRGEARSVVEGADDVVGSDGWLADAVAPVNNSMRDRIELKITFALTQPVDRMDSGFGMIGNWGGFVEGAIVSAGHLCVS